MMNLGESIKYEMDLKNSNYEIVGKIIGVSAKMVYDWCNNTNKPSLHNIILLADYFNCSVDYLINNEKTKYEGINYKTCPPFHIQFKKIIEQYKPNKKAMSLATGIHRSNFYDWINAKTEPQLDSLIKVAAHFGITIDILIGRQ